MAGSNNLQQWNPGATGQLSDADYTSNTSRSGGAANPSVFPPATANKLFYQITTFNKALGDALANKGYVISDANLATLSAVLANIMTAADMAPYAALAGPAFTGAPTTPTPPQSSADGHIANTYWTSTYFAQLAYVIATFAPLSSPPLTGTPTAPSPAGTDSSNRLATTSFVKALAYAPLSLFASSLGSNGYQALPNGLVMQWGFAGVSTATIINFPVSFPNATLLLVSNDAGDPASGTSGTHATTAQPILGSKSQFKGFGLDYTGAYAATNMSWIALGY